MALNPSNSSSLEQLALKGLNVVCATHANTNANCADGGLTCNKIRPMHKIHRKNSIFKVI